MTTVEVSDDIKAIVDLHVAKGDAPNGADFIERAIRRHVDALTKDHEGAAAPAGTSGKDAAPGWADWRKIRKYLRLAWIITIPAFIVAVDQALEPSCRFMDKIGFGSGFCEYVESSKEESFQIVPGKSHSLTLWQDVEQQRALTIVIRQWHNGVPSYGCGITIPADMKPFITASMADPGGINNETIKLEYRRVGVDPKAPATMWFLMQFSMADKPDPNNYSCLIKIKRKRP